ncbi:hypothetical protein [Novosphingobium sp. PC22D]|uniref:hypothetical protein n=1 Tax=Novosphingobium sp. PC22D TaxID=1962403 RepID=UPI001145705D|nr:hypothetical protein [Novosphingobium sp. PC22D]
MGLASPVSGRYRVVSFIHLARIATLPIAGGVIVAFAMGLLHPIEFARAVAGVLLAYGAIDIWDGTAGLESRIERVGAHLQRLAAARRTSVFKILFGGSSLLLGAIGLLFTR